MPDNSIIKTSELPDQFIEGGAAVQTAAANLVLYVADRDCWVQQLWTIGPTESDGETYKFIKVRAGNAINATGAANIDDITDAVEIHSSNSDWAGANTRHDFTINTDKYEGIEAHHLKAGEALVLRASTALVATAYAGFRLYTRRQ